MKKIFAIMLISSALLFFACIGRNNNNSDSKSDSTSSAAGGNGNPSYDPNRGEGKFTKVDVNPNLDIAKAEAGTKIYNIKCGACH